MQNGRSDPDFLVEKFMGILFFWLMLLKKFVKTITYDNG